MPVAIGSFVVLDQLPSTGLFPVGFVTGPDASGLTPVLVPKSGAVMIDTSFVGVHSGVPADSDFVGRACNIRVHNGIGADAGPIVANAIYLGLLAATAGNVYLAYRPSIGDYVAVNTARATLEVGPSHSFTFSGYIAIPLPYGNNSVWLGLPTCRYLPGGLVEAIGPTGPAVFDVIDGLEADLTQASNITTVVNQANGWANGNDVMPQEIVSGSLVYRAQLRSGDAGNPSFSADNVQYVVVGYAQSLFVSSLVYLVLQPANARDPAGPLLLINTDALNPGFGSPMPI